MSALAEAVAKAQAGQVEPAIQAFIAIVSAEPANVAAHVWLSMLFRKTEDLARSVEHAAIAARCAPNNPEVLSNLGLAFSAAGQAKEAAAAFQRTVRLNPNMPNNYLPLAKNLQALGRDQDALRALVEAEHRVPNSFDVKLAAAQSLTNLQRFSQAEAAARSALGLRPESGDAALLLAGALIEQGKEAEVDTHLELTLRSGSPEARAYALTTRGMRLAAKGQNALACESFIESTSLLPRQGFAYLALCRNTKVDASMRPLVKTMLTLAEEPDLSTKDRGFLHFGLGKALEDLGEYGPAMRHYDAGNRLAREANPSRKQFDPAEYRREIDRLIELFPAPLFRKQHAPQPSSAPIFIVGMMRSGTTLLEQIVSSHSQVAAAGEQGFWMSALAECIADDGRIDLAKVDRIAPNYLQQLEPLRAGRPYVTDKLPSNYQRLGLIHLAHPNAKIVHVRRDPRDTCLSIYTTPSRAVHAWMHSRPAIVEAYRQYVRLMAHWEQVLPADRLLTVAYEDLVADKEPRTRAILDFCGLEWEDSCAHPERNERAVMTPSLWQVRQPVYTSSVGRWKRFEPWLAEFAELRA